MNYKKGITEAMTYLATEEKVVFLGEGIVNAGRIYGTLDNVSTDKCVEMPIAENLIVGCAIGLALDDYHPVVVFQRMDFMLCATDALINHLALIPKMSGGQVNLPVIIRAIIGSQKESFDVGPQHNKNLVHLFASFIDTIVIKERMNVKSYYELAYKSKSPTLLVEYKDLYEK